MSPSRLLLRSIARLPNRYMFVRAIDTNTNGGAESEMLRLQRLVLVGKRSKAPRCMSHLAGTIPQHDRAL